MGLEVARQEGMRIEGWQSFNYGSNEGYSGHKVWGA